MRAELRRGIDPHRARDELVAVNLQAKRDNAKKATLAELFSDYVQTLTLAKKRSATDVRYLLDVALKALDGKRKAAAVKKTDISEFIKAKAKDAGVMMANRLHPRHSCSASACRVSISCHSELKSRRSWCSSCFSMY